MLAMEAMVLGPQALLGAAMTPVLSADFSPVPAALQRRKPELQGLKTAVAVLHGSPLVKLRRVANRPALGCCLFRLRWVG